MSKEATETAPVAAEAKPPKKKSPKVLFIERMRREGRGKEFHANLKRIQAETGKGYAHASYQAVVEMGYKGPAEERAIHEKYLQNLHKTAAEIQRGEEQEAMWEEQAVHDFESAMRSLPNTAPPQVELDWVRAHPAMMRKNRSNDQMKMLTLDVNDILSPPHGKAPSKSAVAALQHWVNHPIEFFKSVLSEHKKLTEADEAKAQASKDVGVEEIERLLDEINDGLAKSTTKTASPAESQSEKRRGHAETGRYGQGSEDQQCPASSSPQVPVVHPGRHQ